MSKRILLISNMYPSPQDESYGIFVSNFEKYAVKNGLHIADKAVIKGKGKSIAQKIKKYTFFYFEVIFKGLITKYDIIYVHYITHCAVPLLILKLFSSKPIVLNAHGDDVMTTTLAQRILQKAAKPLVRNSDLIVVPSQYFLKKVVRTFKISATKVFISPSGGVDTVLFKEMPISKKDDFVVGYMSRIENGKGWRVFLEAVSKLKNELNDLPCFKAVVIGDGAERQIMLAEIKKLKLEDVIVYKGRLHQSELPYILNSFNLLIFPTMLKESLGLAGLEAMACSVPVIGSKIGGLTDYIEDARNGFLFTPGNTKELVEKIKQFYQLPQSEKEKIRKQARRTALNFDSSAVAEALGIKLKSLE